MGCGSGPAEGGLTRRWVPVGGASPAHRRPPFVGLRADGGWVGSDGCNGLRGTWAVAPDGRWTATAGPSTKIFCDNVDLGRWLARADRVRWDGEVLVLEAEGREVGRLRPG